MKVIHGTMQAVHSAFLNEEPLGFREGVQALFRGVQYLIARPHYLAVCAAPWALNLIVVGPIVAILLKFLVYDWVVGWAPDQDVWWATAIEVALRIFILPTLFAVWVVVFLLMSMVVGAPFHDKLGELIEQEEFAGRPDLLAPSMPLWVGVRHALVEALKRVGVLIPRLVLALFLGVIPLVGPLIVMVVDFFLAAGFMTLDAFSMPMDRRGIPLEEKIRWVKSNRRFALGFGLPLLVLPCAFFLMPPLATAAATLVYCRYRLREETQVGTEEKAGAERQKAE